MTAHARQRAAERYGLDLQQGDLTAIIAQIVDGRAVLLSREASGAGRYLVQVQSKALKIVYHPDTGHVVTALPIDARNRREYPEPAAPRPRPNKFALRRRKGHRHAAS